MIFSITKIMRGILPIPPSFVNPSIIAAVCLFTLAACCPVRKQIMGDPREPYPLERAAKIGDIVHLPTGTAVSREQMLEVAADARIVYVGETHDNPASHRLQLEILKALAELHPGRQALGMEMFARSRQPALDRWVAGDLDEKAFLKESGWYDNWNMDFAYYRDLLNFAREKKIPIIALNAEKSMIKAGLRKSHVQTGQEDTAQQRDLDQGDPYQREMIMAFFRAHTHGSSSPEAFARVQILWDETMAESVAGYLSGPAGKGKYLMVVTGGNHIGFGIGIPRRVFRLLPTSYILIGGREIDIPPDMRDRLMDVDLPVFPMVPWDFLVYLPYESLETERTTHAP